MEKMYLDEDLSSSIRLELVISTNSFLTLGAWSYLIAYDLGNISSELAIS